MCAGVSMVQEVCWTDGIDIVALLMYFLSIQPQAVFWTLGWNHLPITSSNISLQVAWWILTEWTVTLLWLWWNCPSVYDMFYHSHLVISNLCMALNGLLYAHVLLTLSSPVVSNGYTTKCSKPYWSNPPFLFFWRSGTLALSPERQSARTSKK